MIPNLPFRNPVVNVNLPNQYRAYPAGFGGTSLDKAGYGSRQRAGSRKKRKKRKA